MLHSPTAPVLSSLLAQLCLFAAQQSKDAPNIKTGRQGISSLPGAIAVLPDITEGGRWCPVVPGRGWPIQISLRRHCLEVRQAGFSSSLGAALWEQPGLQVQEPCRQPQLLSMAPTCGVVPLQAPGVSQLQHGQLPAAQKGCVPCSWQESNLHRETPMDF